jgi:transposase-like protein
MSDCKHNKLERIEGPLHGDADYVCKDCGQQLRAEPIQITGRFGLPPVSEAKERE